MPKPLTVPLLQKTNVVFFDNLVIAREYIGPAGEEHGE